MALLSVRINGFDSLSRFTDTPLLRTVCFVPVECMPSSFKKKSFFLVLLFTLHSLTDDTIVLFLKQKKSEFFT